MTDSTDNSGSAYDGDSVDQADATPRFRVVSGNPTEWELAAVTSVLTAMVEGLGNQRMPTAPPIRSAWSHSQRHVRDEIHPGPGAWNRTIA